VPNRIVGMTWQDCRTGRLATRQAESLKFMETVTEIPILRNVKQATMALVIFIAMFAVISVVALHLNGFTFVGLEGWYWRNVIDALFWQ